MGKLLYSSTLVKLHSKKEFDRDDLDEKCQILAEEGFIYNPFYDRFENPLDKYNIDVVILYNSKEKIKSMMLELPPHSYSLDNLKARIGILYDRNARFGKIHSFLGSTGLMFGILLLVFGLLTFFTINVTNPKIIFTYLSSLITGVCCIHYYFSYHFFTDKFTGVGEAAPLFYNVKSLLYLIRVAGIIFILYLIFQYTIGQQMWIYIGAFVGLFLLTNILVCYFYVREWWDLIGYVELEKGLAL